MNWTYIKEFCVVGLLVICGLQTWRLDIAQNSLQQQKDMHEAHVAQARAATVLQASMVANRLAEELNNASEAWKVVEEVADRSIRNDINLTAVNTRLRTELARVRAEVDAGVTSKCSDAVEAALLYADLFDQCKSRYRRMGEQAEIATHTGESCNRSYNAVRSVTLE